MNTITRLTLKAPEQGAYIVNAAFTDEDAASVVPDTLTWSLYNASGGVVNSREDVTVATPAANVDIALSGADLSAGDGPDRYLLIEGAYTSTLGSLPLREQVRFSIENFVGLV